MLKVGGNRRLNQFLDYFNVSKLAFPKKQIYSSKIIHYYRKMIKSESLGEPFDLDPPSKRTMLDPYLQETDSDKSFDKQMINISDDHYAKNFNSVENKYSGVSSGGSYNYNSSNDNSNRFASISSEPVSKYSLSSDSNESYKNDNTLYGFLGSAFETTKFVASTLKDKVSDMDLGMKLQYTGGKTFEVMKYTGSKMYETGSDIYVC